MATISTGEGNASVSQSPLPSKGDEGGGDGSSEMAMSATISLGCSDEGGDVDSSQQRQNESENGSTTEEKILLRQRRRHRNQRILIGLCLAAVIMFVIVDSTTTMYCKSAINSLLQWVEANPAAGILAFTLFVFVATVAFIPGALLTLGAGYVFERAWGLATGLLVGTLTVCVGASAGAIVSFLIGRYLLRGFVDRLAHRYSIFEALDSVMKTAKGFRIMVLLRLSPIIPFNAINYISGVTSISLLSYSLANIAIIPGTVLFVFVGASAACLANNMGSGQAVTISTIVVGVVFAVFAIFITSFYARRELNRIIASRESTQEEGTEHDESSTQDDGDIEEGLDESSRQQSPQQCND